MTLWSSLPAALALSMVIAGLPGIARADMPSGWIATGIDLQHYEIGLDRNVSYTGRSSAYIKAVALPRGFATLMQDFWADWYRGKRVRLSVYVKSMDVEFFAGVWMRVDGDKPAGSPGPPTLAFDNMESRPIKGTTDWSRYEVVLDIPEHAAKIAFGVQLMGRGEIWSDNFEFGVVDASVPVTATNSQVERLPKQPVNLDFEER
jgi:hypothetical protein